jgi:hypothetical protein
LQKSRSHAIHSRKLQMIVLACVNIGDCRYAPLRRQEM